MYLIFKYYISMNNKDNVGSKIQRNVRVRNRYLL
jgi:hypothetical protein